MQTAPSSTPSGRAGTVHCTPDRPAPLAPEPVVQALLERGASEEGRRLVEQAMLTDAEAHGGSISANRVRDLLRPGGIWRPGLTLNWCPRPTPR